MRDRIRIGILGCSDIARRRFLPAIARAKNAVLTAVASRDLEKARRLNPGAAYEAVGYEDLLQRGDVDLVYVTLPNDLHEVWTLRALAKGRHVICEKPLGLSPASVKRMTALARQRGLLVYENLAYLHHPQHRLVRHLIDSGEVGTVRELRTAFRFTLTAPDNFRMEPARGGGAVHDLARYPLSAASFFLRGSMPSFRACARHRQGLNIAVDAQAETSEGERVSLSIGFDRPYECWYELGGDGGKIRVDRAYSTPADRPCMVELIRGTETRTFPVAPHDHFAGMIDHVCGLIRDPGSYARVHEGAERLACLAQELERSCERGPRDTEGEAGHDPVLAVR